MDGCNNCCEIDTVSLTYGSLQVLLWNNNAIIEKINGSNICRQITGVIQYKHSWNQGCIIIINYDIYLLQLPLCKNLVHLKNACLQLSFYNRKRVIHQMGGCNRNHELTQYLWSTCQIHCVYARLQVLF